MIRESFVLRVLSVTFILVALPLIMLSFILFQKNYEDALKRTKNELKNEANERTLSLAHIRPVTDNFLGEVEYFLNLDTQFPTKPDPAMDEKLVKSAAMVKKPITIVLLGAGFKGRYPVLSSSDKSKIGTEVLSQHNLTTLREGGLMEYIYYNYSEDLKRYFFSYYIVKAIMSKNNEFLGYLLVSSPIDNAMQAIFDGAKRDYPTTAFALAERKSSVILQASDQSMVGQYFLDLSPEEKKRFLEEMPGAQIAENPLPNTLHPFTNFFEFTKTHVAQLAYFATPPANLSFGFNDLRFKDHFDEGLHQPSETRAKGPLLSEERSGWRKDSRNEFEYQSVKPKTQVNMRLSFIAYRDTTKLFGDAIRRFFIIYNVYGLIILVGGGAAFWAGLYFARPLHNLADLMNKVRTGDLTPRFREQPFGYEVNALGSIFNETLDTLLRHMEESEKYRIEKEKKQAELEIGYLVQRQLLPQKMPAIASLDIASRTITGAVAKGDFHDVVLKDKNHLALFVADVATEGISACLYSLGLRSYLRAYTFLFDDVEKIVRASDQMFCKDVGESGMFATVTYAMYDIDNKSLKMISCGHVPAFLKRKNGKVISLASTRPAFGLLPDEPYVTQTMDVQEGDFLILYSAGLVKSRNAQGERFSRKRLELLLQREWETADALAQLLVDELKDFCKEGECDTTLLILKPEFGV